MTDDKLRQLLHDADAAAGQPPATTRDLANAINHRVARRRHRRHIAVASIILCVMLALLPLLRNDQPAPPVAKTTTDPAKIQAELSLIRLQAKSESAAIDQLVEHQRLASLRTRSDRFQRRGQFLGHLQRQREISARLLLHEADRTAAPDQYRRVIDLFPETPYASLARQRLDRSDL